MYYFWTIAILGYISIGTWAASALCRALLKRNEDHYIRPEAKVIPFRPDPEEEFVKIHHDV